MGYIRVPVETNPETLASDIFSYIQAQQPGWTPNDGNLDTWIIRAVAAKAAENRSLASDVPDDIYGTLGATLFSIPPIDSVSATGNTTWTLANTAGHTIPDGTYIGLQDSSGNLVTFRTVGDVIVAPGDSVTAAGQVGIRAVDPGTGANGLSGTVTLIDVIDWVTSIAIVGTTSGAFDAETNDAYLNRLTRKLQSLSTVPILPIDFSHAAEDADPGVFRAVAIDMYNPSHNLLTANEASAETDATGWSALVNSVITSSTTFALDGTKSIRMASSGAGDMSMIMAREQAVSPGSIMTVSGYVRAAVIRSTKIGIRWLDASHVAIGSDTFGTASNSTTTGFTQYSSGSKVAPQNAAFMKIIFYVVGTAGAAEFHYVDELMIRHGTGVTWVAGGIAETGNIKTVTEAAVDATGTAVSGPIKTAINTYIQARRETNWINHVMDPNYTNIDVAVSFKTLPGFDAASTQTAVIAAVTNYLDPANWGIDPNAAAGDAASTWVDQTTLYYNELIALASGVQGVDRVTDLTSNVHGDTPTRVDVHLNGPAALTTVGTITATAV